MTAQRKYYLAATAFLSIGAVMALATASYGALFVFAVLAAFTFWLSTRADRYEEYRRPGSTKAAAPADGANTRRSGGRSRAGAVTKPRTGGSRRDR